MLLTVDFSHTRFLNIRLDSISVLDEARHPHMVRDFDASRNAI